MRWAIIDVETTHLIPIAGEIIELAIIRDDGLTFRSKVKPRHINTALPEALEINGYSEADWADAPYPEGIVDMVTTMLTDRVMVGHVVNFDKAHLAELYHRLGQAVVFESFDYHTIDTQTLAFEHLVPHGLDSLSLKNVCAFLDIDNPGPHQAFHDAETTEKVFRRLLRPSRWDRHVAFRLAGAHYKLRRRQGLL